jgi:predicted amidohydrolase
LRVAAIQFPVQTDILSNLTNLAAALRHLEPGDFAVAPEGALSGYESTANFISGLDKEAIGAAIEGARRLVAERRVHLVVGACIFDDGAWFNSSFYMGPDRQLNRYDKINLAQSERGVFEAGNSLPVIDITVEGTPLRFGIQMCREIRYPEQWRALAIQKAQLIAYVNNAVGGADGHELWRSHAISRAAEIQRFIVGANNAAPDQKCPSLVVAPSGKVLSEAAIGATSIAAAEINLDEISDWVINQARGDIVSVRLG